MTYSKVIEFNHKILGIEPRPNGSLDDDESTMSHICLYEEADEFLEATINGDYVAQVDAIIDSIYFAYGILYKLGITEDQFNKIFSIIHDANMSKNIGVNSKRDTGAADAVKPKDWVPPEKAIEVVIFGNSPQQEMDV